MALQASVWRELLDPNMSKRLKSLRRLPRLYRPQSIANCSTLHEHAAGSRAGAPEALQASEYSKLLGPTRASGWISCRWI